MTSSITGIVLGVVGIALLTFGIRFYREVGRFAICAAAGFLVQALALLLIPPGAGDSLTLLLALTGQGLVVLAAVIALADMWRRRRRHVRSD